MLKAIIVLLLITLGLFAKKIEAKYHVEYGIVGKVADINVTYFDDGKRYRIDAYVAAYGHLANLATQHLREHHISKGRIEQGMFHTDDYEMRKHYGKFRSKTLYRANAKRKTLVRIYKLYEKGKFKYSQSKKLPYYSTHDLLTFFLDLPKLIYHTKTGSCKQFRVIGADRKKGRVDVCLPKKNDIKKYENLLDIDSSKDPSLFFFFFFMYRKLYHSKQGELEIAIDRQGIVHKAVLEDVLFFGDVRIVLDKITTDKKR